jgi:predicted Zn-dependent peptidase
MDLIVAGDVDPAAVVERVQALLPPDRFPPSGEISRHWEPEPSGVKERVARAEMDISRPRVLVGFKEVGVDGSDPLRRELEVSVLLDLLFGRSSEFYTKAYERGLIDDSFSFSYSGEDAFGFSLIGGETGEPEVLAEAILEELHKARSRRPKAVDVERSKRKRLGKFIRSFDSPDGAAFLLLGCEPRGIDILQVPKVLTKLSSAGLERCLRAHFDERNYAVSILLPKK